MNYKKTLQQAIEYVLSLKTPALLHKGENYAQFECPVYGYFDIQYFYSEKSWVAFKDLSTWQQGAKIVRLFSF